MWIQNAYVQNMCQSDYEQNWVVWMLIVSNSRTSDSCHVSSVWPQIHIMCPQYVPVLKQLLSLSVFECFNTWFSSVWAKSEKRCANTVSTMNATHTSSTHFKLFKARSALRESVLPARDLVRRLATHVHFWDNFIPINIFPYKGALSFESLLTSHNPKGILTLIWSDSITFLRSVCLSS